MFQKCWREKEQYSNKWFIPEILNMAERYVDKHYIRGYVKKLNLPFLTIFDLYKTLNFFKTH